MVPKTIKTGICASLIVSCMLGFFLCQNALCVEAVSVKDGLLSVNLKDNSLLEVARDIEKQSGVWFRGDETLFQEKISVTFTDLPLEEGLKRILTFDAKNKVAGVMVMGEGKPAGAQPGRPGAQPPRVAMPPPSATRPAPTVRSRPSTSTPPAAVRRPPRTIPQPASGRSATRPGSVVSQSPNPDDSEIQENAPGSGGPAGPDSPLPPAFRVMENAPPPAAPVANKEPPAASKIIRNAQPPGGTTEAGGVSPVGSTPAKNASSSGEDSKTETTP
jgi:hypothetical protein